jgi:hypothetical protein
VLRLFGDIAETNWFQQMLDNLAHFDAETKFPFVFQMLLHACGENWLRMQTGLQIPITNLFLKLLEFF